jgi:NAD+ kinase
VNPVLKRIGVVVHPGRPTAVALGKELVRWAADVGVELRTLEQERGCLGSEVPCVGPDEFPLGLDLVVVLGGDGTLLRAVGLSLRAQVPVLGVNVGRLGFLTEVEPEGLANALEAIWEGRYHVERRSTLRVRSTVDGHLLGEDLAANDLVIDKGARERLVSVAVYVDDRFLARYSADGLIVASPTGSTAYSFSAGGPIVSPHLDAVLLTAIAPHMVFNRSLVLHPSEALRLEVLPDGPVMESIDGRAVRELPPGAVVEVRRSDLDALLVRLGDADFYGLVRNKFRLADAPDSLGGEPEAAPPRTPPSGP